MRGRNPVERAARRAARRDAARRRNFRQSPQWETRRG